MESMAKYMYPQIVWREGRKMLWNSIHRKALKNRPEERVRLRVVEYLLMQGWSKHRITTEEAIGNLADTSMRTDIICYNQQFEPRILIECKAEHIPLTAKTAQQVARYNQNVSAPFLLMTNGLKDLWYKTEGKNVVHLEQGPEILRSETIVPQYDFGAWHRRGFAGSKAVPPLRKWLAHLLPQIWHPGTFEKEILFLSFKQELSDLNLNHYYSLWKVSENRRLALSTLATAYGGTRLVGILSEDGQNKAVLEINMDLTFEEKAPNATLYSHEGEKAYDIREAIDFRQEPELNALIKGVQELITI